MFKCDICGRKIHKKIRMGGYTLCNKHMHQLHKYGYFKDNNPRTQNDLNEFRKIDKNTIEFDVYDTNSEINGHFIIDAKDLPLVRYHKWRKDSNDRIITGNCTNKHPRRELSRILLNITDPTIKIDHKDCDPFNNKRNNLRVCTQQDNVYNKSFMSNNTSTIIGVSWDKQRERWAPEIRYGRARCHLGRYGKFEEAVLARYTAAELLFQDFHNDIQKQKMLPYIQTVSASRKQEIQTYVIEKLKHKQML